MADFQEKVMGITGLTIDGSSSAPSRAEFSTFLNDGVIDVTNRCILINPRSKENFSRESSEQTSNGFNPGTTDIIAVLRESGTNGEWYPCKKADINLQYRVTDTDSLYYASKYNPVYMITENRGVHVYPTPGSSNDGFKVLYVNYSPEESDGTALDHASTGIKWFPNDKIHLVVIYASMKSLQSAMSALHSNSDITTALTAINTELDETQGVCDKIDADLVLAKAEIALAKDEAAELATQTDNGGDFETACDAMATELNKVDNVIVEASTEFDKVDNVIVEGSVEVDKSTALLDLGEVDSEAAVNTAITLLITAVAQAASAADKFTSGTSDSQFDTNATWDATHSQLTRVKDAVDKVELLIETDKPASGYDAHDLLQAEDMELLQGNLSIVNAEINRAKLHIQEWVAIGDMRAKEVNSALAEADGQTKKIQTHLQQAQAKRQESQSRLSAGSAYIQEAKAIVSQGNAYIEEAKAYIAQAQGYAAEVNARGGFSSAKSQAIQGYINTAKSYIGTAQGFSNEIQSKIAISGGYAQEIQSRMANLAQEYQWYNSRYKELKAEYDGAFALMRPPQQPQQGAK